MLEPDFLFDDERFVWGKRRTVRGEERSQVALMRGKVPVNVFVTGAGRRKLAKYAEGPMLEVR